MEISQLIHLITITLVLYTRVDEFQDDNVSCVYWGKEAAAIQWSFYQKDLGESPLLPSPLSSLKIGVISNFSTKKVNYLTKHYLWKNEGSPRSEQILERIIPNKDVNKERF